MRTIKAAAIYSFLFASAPALAVNDFRCTVKEVYDLMATGLLIPGPGFVAPEAGSEFTVNRQSGQVTAPRITNTMSGYMPKVYNAGLPEGKAYLAVTLYPMHSTIDLLEIHYSSEGKLKPFIYKGAMGEVVTGLCIIQ